jgi:hypothetical protein
VTNFPQSGSEIPHFFHAPPAGAYVEPLARELTNRGIPARMVGRGVTAYLVFEDAELYGKFGPIYFHQPINFGRSSFIWSNGDVIGPVSDIQVIAERVAKVVNPPCMEGSTE